MGPASKRASSTPSEDFSGKRSRRDSSWIRLGRKSELKEEPLLPYCDGAIRRVSLVNFMVHQKFDWEPGPRVNVVTGRNGAGKSSILQAIVIGLGGRARDTKRGGKNLSQFVRRDAFKAEVKIHLFNGGPESYRNDVYGDEIVFERVIFANAATSSHSIRSSNGTVIYTSRAATEEREKILQHFTIELNNPLILLQQEEAKGFFQVENDKTMYDYFSRGSLLKVAKEQYCQANIHLDKCRSALKSKQLQQEEAKKKFEQLDGAWKKLEMHNQEDELQRQSKWGFERDQKETLDTLVKRYKNADEALRRFEETGNPIETRLAEAQGIRLNAQMNVANVKDKERAALAVDTRRKGDLEKLKEAEKSLSEQLDSLRSDQRNHHATIRALREEIRVLRMNKTAHNDQSVRNQLEEMLTKLEEKKSHLETSIKQLGETRETYELEIKALDSKELKILKSLGSKEREMERLRHELEAAQSRAGNVVSRFGKAMAGLVDDIQSHGKFQKKPVGPIGRHVKLRGAAGKDDNLALLLETALGARILRAFIVDNDRDRRELEKSMSCHFKGQRPTIYVKPIIGKRYNVDHGSVKSTKEVPTMLDYLDFDDPDAFNLVVDRTKAESVLVISQTQAQQLFSNTSRVPANTTSAITPDFYRFYPPTHGNYSSYYINKPNRQWNLLMAEHDHKRQQQEALSDMSKAINEFKEAKKSVKAERAGATDRLEDVRMDLKETQRKLATAREEISKTKLKHQQHLEEKRSVAELEEVILQKEVEITESKRRENELKGNKKSEDLGKLGKLITESVAELRTLKLERDEAEERLKEAERNVQIITKEKKLMEVQFSKKRNAVSDIKKQVLDQTKAHKEAERAALSFSGGKRPRDEELGLWSASDLHARLKEMKAMSSKVEASVGLNRDQLEVKRKEAQRRYVSITEKVAATERDIADIEVSMISRKTSFITIQNIMKREISRQFTLVMKDHNMLGKLKINTVKDSLEIHVRPSNGNNNKEGENTLVPLANLSGGERSKTLVCLIHALWHHQSPPFRCLDEWDVFLDDKSRKTVERMLVESTKVLKHQFFFISPQNSLYNDPKQLEADKKTVLVTVIQK